MSFFRFFRRSKPAPSSAPSSPPEPSVQPTHSHIQKPSTRQQKKQTTNPWANPTQDVRRYFHNHHNFQCYTSWFAHWGGWISAGHCLTDAQDHLPDFAASQSVIKWPDGLDAAIVGCILPPQRPPTPRIGQDILIRGYPAGSRNMEQRTGRIYFERMPGQWIAHIFEPDEPVVTGMSGGPVLDAQTLKPIGITITRNSPADLNNDRDPDESADFIALSAVWDAVKAEGLKTGNV